MVSPRGALERREESPRGKQERRTSTDRTDQLRLGGEVRPHDRRDAISLNRIQSVGKGVGEETLYRRTGDADCQAEVRLPATTELYGERASQSDPKALYEIRTVVAEGKVEGNVGIEGGILVDELRRKSGHASSLSTCGYGRSSDGEEASYGGIDNLRMDTVDDCKGGKTPNRKRKSGGGGGECTAHFWLMDSPSGWSQQRQVNANIAIQGEWIAKQEERTEAEGQQQGKRPWRAHF